MTNLQIASAEQVPGAVIELNSKNVLIFMADHERHSPAGLLSSLQAEGSAGHLFQRHHNIHSTAGNCLFRHSEHDAAGLVLCDGRGSSFLHLTEALGAIVAHASHDDANRLRAGSDGYGTKKNIHAWSMSRN